MSFGREAEKLFTRRMNTVDRGDNCLPTGNGKEEIEYYIKSQQSQVDKQQLMISNQFKIKLKNLLEE